MKTTILVLLSLFAVSDALKKNVIKRKAWPFAEEKKEEIKVVEEAPKPPAKNATASVYVMNLDSRSDRCQCMKSQLSGSPYKVTRMSAATGLNMHEKCGEELKLGGGGRDGMGGESALMCTNYMVWKKELAKEDPADFVIILEDDVAIKKATFWPRVHELLNGPCQDFEYLAVDTFWTWINNKEDNKTKLEMTCKRNGGERENFHKLSGQGAHMQIIRTHALPKIADFARRKGGAVVDHFNVDMDKEKVKGVRVRAWQPKIVVQFTNQESWGNNPLKDNMPKGCESSVQESDLEPKKEKTFTDVFETVKTASTRAESASVPDLSAGAFPWMGGGGFNFREKLQANDKEMFTDFEC